MSRTLIPGPGLCLGSLTSWSPPSCEHSEVTHRSLWYLAHADSWFGAVLLLHMSPVRGQITYLGTRSQMTILGACGAEAGPVQVDCVRIFLVARRFVTGKKQFLSSSQCTGRKDSSPFADKVPRDRECLHPEYVLEPGCPKCMLFLLYFLSSH